MAMKVTSLVDAGAMGRTDPSRPSRERWLFLAAYTCSGLAALIYEVSWTRLLTLYMGHSLAAASTVVAAFMGGLAAGSILGGRLAPRLTPARSLHVYISLEIAIGLVAIVVPFELAALMPLLAWSYHDGAPGLLFGAIRLLSCLAVMFVPALALGATFPIAVRWFVNRPHDAGRTGGVLYAVNTAGAAVGALAAGFALIPAIGVRRTTLVGVAAGGVAALGLLVLIRRVGLHADGGGPPAAAKASGRAAQPGRPRERHGRMKPAAAAGAGNDGGPLWLAAAALGVSGFSALMYEIAWIRVLSLVVGPTTYAFSATVTALIGGTAAGSALGSAVAGRTRRPAFWLALGLSFAAIAASWSASLVGGYVPHRIAGELARSGAFNQSLPRHTLFASALIVPAALCLGAAFPLAFAMVGGSDPSAARPFSVIYAINTMAAVAGALIAGFVAIPVLGLQHTLWFVSALLLAAALVVVTWGGLSRGARATGLVPVTLAVAMLIWSPRWDRELLASGVYKYAPYVDKDLDLESALKAGTLVYYREGASSTVSVKRMAGTLSLSVDGKVDASNAGDMLTQKVLAHLPLLLHRDPHDVCIIGLGSGVTLASALVHPIARADVVEISPEVVEASRYFADDNRHALDDPRTHVILGDGRSHMLLSSRAYDVIVSEPSNPWMAGVAALFTREFFTAVRKRLRPGGIVCQWAHTYDISDADLRSIVGTFASVFPGATAWLVGDSDVLLVASSSPGTLDAQLANIEQGWQRPGVAADLRAQFVVEPFGLLSLYAAGPSELKRYAGAAAIQTDDRMGLEFSGPRAVGSRASDGNAASWHQLLDERGGPLVISRARQSAGPAQWRDRGAMLLAAGDYGNAYDNYARAVSLDPTDAAALDGVVRAAVAAHREDRALELLRSSTGMHPQATPIWIAMSKLLAAGGSSDPAIAAAQEACNIEPIAAAALEQLASIFADTGDAARLDPVVARLQQVAPDRPAWRYYAAAARFLRGQFPEALQLAQQAAGRDDRNAAAYNLVGAIQASLGHNAEARDAFHAALRLNARDSATYVNLGLLEMSSANSAAAAGYFEEALSLDPKSTAARQGLAQARP
jgi:spermidine synthase